jgi:DNA-binding YbaB/EbfC family protein
MNQQVMLRKLKKMQDEMLQTQREIEETVFKASAGGVVTVEIYGTKEIKAVKVSEDFDVEGKEDLEMLSDMVVAACNETYKKIDKVTEEKMSKYSALTGGFGGLF